MLSLYNIWTIAAFEIKTLSRSWFLRIFAGLGIGLLFLFDLVVFTDIFGGRAPRDFNGMSSSLPYYNLLFFNVVQAIIAIFLASDFLKRDKTLDTTEAIYIRSMTNSDYVLGKTVGIFTIFAALNIFILSQAFLFNILSSSNQLNFSAYILYPLSISLPTLIFILGLSLLIMTIIRNQAVTFILLLGYVSLTLFYLGSKYYNIFDYTGFYIPMLYSDFIGFGNEVDLLLHRSSYLFIGLSFIFLTMFLFRRLPQSLIMKRISLILAIITFMIGITTGFLYVNKFLEGEKLRLEMIELNKKYFEYPTVSIISNQIELTHVNNSISCRSTMKVANESSEDLSELIFCLNPGLNILKVHSNSEEINYLREQHIIKIELQSPLRSDEEKIINIEYAGNINEDACYLDINNDMRHELKQIVMYTSHKSYSLISPNYLLLTAESLWYPRSGVTFNPLAQFEQQTDFTDYSLSVKTDTALTVISQGIRKEEEHGIVNFEHEFPLPKVSLIIGDYVNRSIEVDSVEYNLYTLEGHNYFEEYFDEISDTLSALLREYKQDYEREINLDYPFKRFSIVETPIQFTQYSRSWSVAFESTQPEMSLLPENGVSLNEADFRLNKRRQERFGDRRNQVTLPRENQSNLLKRFITGNLLDGPNSTGYRSRRDIRQNFINPYSVFPNYYSFVSSIISNELPIMNSVLELYLKVEPTNSEPFVRDVLGLTNMERAIQI
jgi:ABC-type transport system involved in multi-copper enzyme maturation permease subunit